MKEGRRKTVPPPSFPGTPSRIQKKTEKNKKEDRISLRGWEEEPEVMSRGCCRPAPYTGLDYNDSFCSALIIFASAAMVLVVMILMMDAIEEFCQRLHLAVFFAPQVLGLLCVVAAAYSSWMRRMAVALGVTVAMILLTGAHVGMSLDKWSECLVVEGNPEIISPSSDGGGGGGGAAASPPRPARSWPMTVFASSLCSTEDLTEGMAWVIVLELLLLLVYICVVVTLVRAMNNLELHSTCCFSDMYIEGAAYDSVCGTCARSKRRCS